jgi:hypothetical protein
VARDRDGFDNRFSSEELVTHGTKNPLSFGKNLNTAVENKWIIVVLLGVGDNRR